MQQNEFNEILGQLIYGNAVQTWNSLTPEKKRAFLDRARQETLLGAVYHLLDGQEDAFFEDDWRQQLLKRQATSLRNEIEFQRFVDVLQKASIRFVPIKGIDLAHRVYPSPWLRSFQDWDILFHPDELERVLQVLQEDGWHSAVPLSVERCRHFHFPPCYRHGITLEAHRMLPMFKGCSPHSIWEHCHPTQPGSCHYLLEPELNLLMLARHASEGMFCSPFMGKFLLDTAFLLHHETVDWPKCRKLCLTLHQPYPGDLLAAFPMFFPQTLRDAMEPDPKRTAAYQELFRSNMNLFGLTKEDWNLSNHNAFSKPWLKQRLRHCSLRAMRIKYQLPPNAGNAIAAWYLSKDLMQKVIHTIWYVFKGKSALRRHYDLLDVAEGRQNGSENGN